MQLRSLSTPTILLALVLAMSLAWRWSQPDGEVHAALSLEGSILHEAELTMAPAPSATSVSRPSTAPAGISTAPAGMSTAPAGPTSPPPAMTAPVSPRPQPRRPRPAEVQPTATRACLQVLVLNSRGEPLPKVRLVPRVAGARVEGIGLKENVEPIGDLETGATTNEAGRAALLLPPGASLDLLPIAPGTGVMPRKPVPVLVAGATTELTLMAQPMPRAPWLVRLAQPEGPAPREAWSLDVSAHETERITVSAVNSPLRWMEGNLWSGWGSASSSAFKLIGAQGCAPRLVRAQPAARTAALAQQISLAPGASLSVQARPGARLELSCDLSALADPGLPTLAPREVRWEQAADDRGMVRFEGLPSGVPLRLTVAGRPLPAPEPITLVAGSLRHLELDAPDGPGTLRGCLRSETGAPLPGVEVWLAPASRPEGTLWTEAIDPVRRAVTDRRGEFEVTGLAATGWWVGPAPNSGLAPVTQWFEVEQEAGRVDLEVVAESARSLRLEVVDASGLKCRGARVRLLLSEGTDLVEVRTDQKGEVELQVPSSQVLHARVMGDASVAGCSAREVRPGQSFLRLVLEETTQTQVLVTLPGGTLYEGKLEAELRAAGTEVPLGPVVGPILQVPALEVLGEDPGAEQLLVLRTEDEQCGSLVIDPSAAGSTTQILQLAPGSARLIENRQGLPLQWRILLAGRAVAEGRLAVGARTSAIVPREADVLEVSTPGARRTVRVPLCPDEDGWIQLPLPSTR